MAKLNRCGPDLENQSIDGVRLILYTCSNNGGEKRRRLEQIGQRLGRRIGTKCAAADRGLSQRPKQRGGRGPRTGGWIVGVNGRRGRGREDEEEGKRRARIAAASERAAAAGGR